MNSQEILLKNSKAYLNNNNCDIYKEISAESFVDKFNNALPYAPSPECVNSHAVEECKKMKCLHSKNGFVAIEHDGNITSVMRDTRMPRKDEKRKEFLRDLMANAKANGGNKLDCFAVVNIDIKGNERAGLADMYAKLGFIPVCRDKFNKDFAPDGWNYERNGEADVIFMYNNDSVDKMLEYANKKKYPSYLDYRNNNKVPYIQDLPGYDPNKSSYDQALAYRDKIMEEDRTQRNQMSNKRLYTANITIDENVSTKENTDEDTTKLTDGSNGFSS